jgi:hypothetical protein
MSEQVSLRLVAPFGKQYRPLLFLFDPLPEHIQLEAMSRLVMA